MLEEIEHELLMVANAPPDLPIIAEEIVRSVKNSSNIAHELVTRNDVRLLHAYWLIGQLDVVLHSLDFFIGDLHELCRIARDIGDIGQPNPCDTVTLDYTTELITLEFEEVVRLVRDSPRGRFATAIDLRGRREGFIDALRYLSLYCVQFMGVNCLKYASPLKVASSPLRSHIIDLVSATRVIGDYIERTYRGIGEWRVGSIRLYIHPRTADELLGLAEHASNVLHKITEAYIREQWWKEGVAVCSLADRVEITVAGAGVAHIVVKPGWLVETYLYLDLLREREKLVEIMRRVLEERGFKTRSTGYGFEVTILAGNVKEAVKLVCVMSASVVARNVSVEKAYETAVSDIELIESKLREQKPLKRRKVGL
jgi:hypothetical protein